MTVKFKKESEKRMDKLAKVIASTIFTEPKKENDKYIIGGLELAQDGTLSIEKVNEGVYFRRIVLMIIAEVENHGFVTESLHFE